MLHARRLCAALSLLALAACSTPQGSGSASSILAGAGSAQSAHAVRPVTRETLPTLLAWPATSAESTIQGWIARSRGPADPLIEAGDFIEVAVWDNEADSLLTSTSQKVATLPVMRVTSKGTVFLPYANEVYIAKMTPDAARAAIEAKMRATIPSAQVQLSLKAGRRSTVDLVSGVRSPGAVPLPDRDFTVMSLIAQGGGVPEQLRNPQVRLAREGRLYGIAFDKLLQNPGLDTTLRGGDKVFVESDDRYFLSLGAAGTEAQIPFPSDKVTALDALSLIGGLRDDRADPKGILILRDYPASALTGTGPRPDKERMIFTLDLTNADGLFSAGEFPIYDRDLVLVTESPVTTADTLLGLIAQAVGIADKI